MTGGRPPLGPRLARNVEASGLARKRLEVILETIAGERTIAQACAELGIQETQFHDLRTRALSSAASSLEMGQAGRPCIEVSPEQIQVATMEAELKELRLELRAAQVREEIAAVMPHLLKGEKKSPGG